MSTTTATHQTSSGGGTARGRRCSGDWFAAVDATGPTAGRRPTCS